MKATAIYKKVGRRYEEIGVCDNEAFYYPHGAHLVVSAPGSTLTRYNIEPAHAALLAAAATMRKAMLDAIHGADRMKLVGVGNRQRELTAKEKKAWAAYVAIAGEPKSLYLEGASMHDAIDAGIKALTDAIQQTETK